MGSGVGGGEFFSPKNDILGNDLNIYYGFVWPVHFSHYTWFPGMGKNHKQHLGKTSILESSFWEAKVTGNSPPLFPAQHISTFRKNLVLKINLGGDF